VLLLHVARPSDGDCGAQANLDGLGPFAAAGGVGTFAVQIAKSMGAEVTGVCSTRNADLVRSIGADRVIDYTREDHTRDGRRYDLILDNVMNHSPSECRRALAPEGMLLLNNGTGGGRWIGTLGRMVGALVLSRFVRQRLRLAVVPRKEDLPVLSQFIEAGKIRPVIDRTYPLSETPEAIRHLGAGHARGKVIISV
jgi:NADPH:quinone reductase-like Zn-dependent oxidoreductase